MTRDKLLILIGIMTGMFLSALEITVVGTAAPRIVADLGGFTSYSWLFSIYLATSSISMPLWGRASDHYGRKPTFILSMMVFTIASLLCGISSNLTQLIVCRGLQGFGAGGLVPIAFTIASDIFEIETRTKLQGWFGSIWGFSSLIGPFIGGLISDRFGWQWIFFINMVPGFAAITFVYIFYQETPLNKGKLNIPKASILLSFLVMISLLLFLDQIHSRNWVQVSALFVAIFLSLIAFIRSERLTEFPLVPRELFQNQLFKMTCLSGFFCSAIVISMASFIPLVYQLKLNYTATESGLMLFPFTVSWIVFGIISARTLLKYEYRKLLLFGFSLTVLGFGLYLYCFDQLTLTNSLVCLAIVGCGMAFNYPIVLIMTQYSVPRHMVGFVTSGIFWVRSIGSTIGVSITGFVMVSSISQNLPGIQTDLLLRPETLIKVSEAPAMQTVIFHALFLTFMMMFLLSIANFATWRRFPEFDFRKFQKNNFS